MVPADGCEISVRFKLPVGGAAYNFGAKFGATAELAVELLQVVAEAFADRAYNDDGSLVSRRDSGAVLHDPQQVAQRMLQLVQTGTLLSITGQPVRIAADSICVHGDSPGAVAMTQHLYASLSQAGIALRAFAGSKG